MRACVFVIIISSLLVFSSGQNFSINVCLQTFSCLDSQLSQMPCGAFDRADLPCVPGVYQNCSVTPQCGTDRNNPNVCTSQGKECIDYQCQFVTRGAQGASCIGNLYAH